MLSSVFWPSSVLHGLVLASCSVDMTDCTSSMTYFRSLVVRLRDSKGTCMELLALWASHRTLVNRVNSAQTQKDRRRWPRTLNSGVSMLSLLAMLPSYQACQYSMQGGLLEGS